MIRRLADDAVPTVKAIEGVANDVETDGGGGMDWCPANSAERAAGSPNWATLRRKLVHQLTDLLQHAHRTIPLSLNLSNRLQHRGQ